MKKVSGFIILFAFFIGLVMGIIVQTQLDLTKAVAMRKTMDEHKLQEMYKIIDELHKQNEMLEKLVGGKKEGVEL